MELRIGGMCHFILLIAFFLATLGSYDPLSEIAAVHQNLRVRYQMEEVRDIKEPQQIYHYISKFVNVTYSMTSALVDANTMNSIDPARCFDLDTNDVCRLTYWEMPSRRPNRENYVNLDSLFKDEISNQNYRGVMDCTASPRKPNCLNWTRQVDPSLRSSIMGLTPEDPVILDSRLDFPFAQVVPLAPIVWQTRSPRVPCSGFGDTYNVQVLGAGACSPAIRCNPATMTSFNGPKPNPHTNRTQSIFVTYEEDAFFCVDRSKEERVFYDKSWHPWASYSDLATGRKLKSETLAGRQVFYKFFSDSSYLQAPVLGTVFYNKTDPCQGCQGYSWPECTDPIEEGPGHPMWKESSLQSRCSGRKTWIDRYLNAKDKKSTFLTLETTHLVVAALVITPQMDGLADITTLVRVTFTVGQSGSISAEPDLQSISETLYVPWCSLLGCTVLLAAAYPIHPLRRWFRDGAEEDGSSLWALAFDVAGAMAVIAYMIWNMVLEFSPPHTIVELTAAFATNEQDAYFQSFKNILEYTANIGMLKQFGFYLIVALFFRLVMLLDFHPRLGLVAKVATQAADDTMHFLVQMTLMFMFLAFLGHWSFGSGDHSYATIGRSIFTLFRFFVGDFLFPDDPPAYDYLAFLFIYVLMVFIMMVNFLLAIVVNAHTKVMEGIDQMQTEQNFVADIGDLLCCYYYRVRFGWPKASVTLSYIEGTMRENENIDPRNMSAVTAAELVECFRGPHALQIFETQRDARAYLKWYAQKLQGSGDLLIEHRVHMRFAEGRYLGQDEDGNLDEKNQVTEDVREDELLPTASTEDMLRAIMRQLQQVQKKVDDLTPPAENQEHCEEAHSGVERSEVEGGELREGVWPL